jgi:phosphopantetheine--protein transferase-like protein
LFKIILKKEEINSTVYVSQMSEEIPNEFKSLFPNLHPKRLAEKYNTKLLIEHLGLNYQQLKAAPSGKPYLTESNFHVSISHTNNLGALQVSETKKVGIDIQEYSPVVNRIKTKFCNPKELDYISTLNPEEQEDFLHKTWCAKEACFKYFGENVDFKEDLIVSVLDPEKSVFMMKAKNENLVVRQAFVKGCFLAYLL